MQKKTYLDKHYDKCKKILQENGENLDLLLASYKARLEYRRLKKERKSKITFRAKLNKDIYFRFKMVALSEDIGSKALLEAFMNYFVEGDEELQALLDKLAKYHIKSFHLSSKKKEKKRILINNLNKLHEIPIEWWRKYTDLNNEEFDF